MTPVAIPTIAALRNQAMMTLHAHWKLFLLQGVLLFILGLVAVALPYVSSIAIEQLVGWLFIIGGFIRIASLLRTRRLPAFWWSASSSVLAMVFGVLLVASPLPGEFTLAFIMTVVFVIEGLAGIFVALEFRAYVRNWPWTLFASVVSLLLAYLIWNGWPNTATWVVGLYVGINMVFLGTSLTFTALAARDIGPPATLRRPPVQAA